MFDFRFIWFSINYRARWYDTKNFVLKQNDFVNNRPIIEIKTHRVVYCYQIIDLDWGKIPMAIYEYIAEHKNDLRVCLRDVCLLFFRLRFFSKAVHIIQTTRHNTFIGSKLRLWKPSASCRPTVYSNYCDNIIAWKIVAYASRDCRADNNIFFFVFRSLNKTAIQHDSLRNAHLKSKPFLFFISFGDNFGINNVMARNIFTMHLFIYYY